MTATESPTFGAGDLRPASRPTFYFIGVSTGQSSIRRVFPAWAQELGLGDVELVGIDLEPHSPVAQYRRVVEFLGGDELSLGALVTTHKIDLFRAAGDLFDHADPLAVLLDEVSCISKRDGNLWAHAKDPITAGFAVDAIIPPGSWAGRSAFLMGAGGSSIALAWHLTRPERGADRPAEIVVSNRSQPRLDSLAALYEQFADGVPLRLAETPTAAGNDTVLAGLPGGALVVNATGLGKDAPGSPLTGTARFPDDGGAWDLNYRGDLIFLDQARSQQRTQNLQIHDGWVYFIHGWTRVMAEVFDMELPVDGPEFDRLSEIARSVRTGAAR